MFKLIRFLYSMNRLS